MLKIYTLADAQQWDAVVRSFPQYDIYYLSGYVKGFWLHGDGEPLLIAWEGPEARGINVVFKRAIRQDSRFADKLQEELYDFISPYGYGGWLLDGSGDFSGLMEEYDHWCRKNRIVSEFVRFHPLLKIHLPVQNTYDVVALGSTVALDLTSPEVVWENMTSKNRNMVRKAQKNGLQICRANGPEIYEVFREIYELTMEKDQAADYYYFGEEYYRSIREDLARNAQVFYVRTEEGAVAAADIRALRRPICCCMRQPAGAAKMAIAASIWAAALARKRIVCLPSNRRFTARSLAASTSEKGLLTRRLMKCCCS